MKLANVAGDLDSRHVEATNVFKMVTGQDVIYAERKNGQPFRFTPWSVPIFSANKIPTSSDTSVGYLARWEVIPFTFDLTKLPDGPDDSIERYIVAHELPGIARRGVAGLARLMKRNGFERPTSVQEAFTGVLSSASTPCGRGSTSGATCPIRRRGRTEPTFITTSPSGPS